MTAGLILEASMIAAMLLWGSGWQMVLACIPYSVAETLNNAAFDPYFADLNDDDAKQWGGGMEVRNLPQFPAIFRNWI